MRNTKIVSNIRRSERGVIAIFVAAVIIPLLFILFTLSFDIASYYTGEEGVQALADDAAMYAYKFLPNKVDAVNAAKMFLDQNGSDFNITSNNATINVTSDFISINLDSSFPLSFAKLFNKDAALPIKRVARVRSTPLDAYIAIDTSAYLAPPIVAGQLPWSNDQGNDILNNSQWPPSTFFTELFPIGVEGLPMSTQDEKTIVHSLLTQQCFNPVFSELKLAAISLYDYLSSFDLNSIGVGFYPGTTYAIDQARSVLPAGLRPDQENSPGEADFESYYGGSYNSNVWCAGIAEHERVHAEYRFRDLLPTYVRRIPEAPQGERMIFTDTTPIFNQKYREYLQTRDVIWSRAINTNGQSDIPELLRSLSSALYAASADKNRGGLVASSSKVGIVLAGNLPQDNISKYPNGVVSDGILPAINELKNDIASYGGNVTIYFLFFKHRGVTDIDWDSKIESLAQVFKEHSNMSAGSPEGSSLNIRIIRGEKATDLISTILPLLMLEKRTTMVSE